MVLDEVREVVSRVTTKKGVICESFWRLSKGARRSNYKNMGLGGEIEN